MNEDPRRLPPRSPVEGRIDRVLVGAVKFLTSAVGFILIFFVALSIAGIIVRTAGALLFSRHDLEDAAFHGMDDAFLAIILLELVHTTLSRQSIGRQVQEFLVIGITSGVRSGLEVAADARNQEAHGIVTNLAINSLGVLVLVLALWLVRRMPKSPDEFEPSD